MNTTKTKNNFVLTQLEMGKFAGQRKHTSQLNNSEIMRINERLMAVEKWNTSNHTFSRLKEKGINATVKDIVSVIGNASIIEYKIDYNRAINRNEERVVLRANDIVNRCFNLNVVYSLTTATVVTVWINHISDFHDTLDWTIYNADMKVF